MIDLKTVKNITIAEGSVTKITDSSGVVLWQKVVAPSSSLDVDLNNQWIASTKTLDGYNVYMSNSNHNVNSGYASMKFKFKGMPDFKIWINSYAESSFDYTVAWNMDVDYPASEPSSSTSGVKAHTSGKQYNPTNITAFTEVDYANDGGEHFVVVTFRKDGSVNNNDDRGYVAVKLTLLSTTWVVSATEFVKKDDKYYERINEVGTYEGGVTANTGNYKEGNELPVTYKQGSADDYIVNDGKMYYKNYIYVTPKDQEINTGDYIQGDYIGEATPSMKVTYTDNTEKTFYNLTSIEENTDSNKANAKSVEIYDSVTSIGKQAFNGCSSLTSITIPNSVTSIGNYAFYNCSKLTDITIPDSVTSIGEGAFAICSSLTEVTIPNSVTSIGTGAFQNTGLASVTIPDSVTSIGQSAFNGCSSLTSVTIPESVTSIGIYAFNGCSNLTDITIPSGVTSIGKYAFYGCSNLTDITIPSGVTSIEQNTFTNCSRLTDITIPDSVTSIGGNAFSNCSSLTSITIPSGVTIIGESAFYNCSNLTDITIPSGVTSIDMYAFYGCSKLTDITIPSGVTSIGQSAFRDCNSLATVTIQNSTSKLAYNSNAFANIPSTAKLYVPSNLLSNYQSDSSWTNAFGGGIYGIEIPAMKVTYVDGTEKTFNNLTSIEDNTVSNKANVKDVEIYDGVTIIGKQAFFNCSDLTSITIPNSVTSIGNDAFMSCSSLTSITIPNSVTSIGGFAFRSCSSLTSVTIPSGVTSISNGVFYDCSSLTSVTIPDSVTSIGNYAFSNCSKLESVTIENSTSKLAYNTNAFANISSTAKLYVPASVLSDYQADSAWTGAFGGGIFEIPS